MRVSSRRSSSQKFSLRRIIISISLNATSVSWLSQANLINSWQTDRVLPDICGSSDATFIGDSHSSAQSGQIKADTAATLTIFQFKTHTSAQTD